MKKEKKKRNQQASQYLPLAGRSQYRLAVRLAGTFHGGRSRLNENSFLQAGNGQKFTNEKTRQCYT
jgi:hypothetical protein